MLCFGLVMFFLHLLHLLPSLNQSHHAINVYVELSSILTGSIKATPLFFQLCQHISQPADTERDIITFYLVSFMGIYTAITTITKHSGAEHYIHSFPFTRHHHISLNGSAADKLLPALRCSLEKMISYAQLLLWWTAGFACLI